MQALQFNANPLRFILAKTCAAIFGKASYYRGPGKTVKLVDIPESTLPSEDWVKIRTQACGFCGSDLNLLMLHDSPSAEPFTSFPCIMGHEFIGEITAAGSGVSGFKKGDRVAVNPTLGCHVRGLKDLCPGCRAGRVGNCERQTVGNFLPGMFLGITQDLNGGFAPFVAAHKDQLFHVPEALSLDAAVMTEPAAVALQTVYDNLPQENEKVLIVGGGVIGNLIVQSIRALVPECHISVIEPSPMAAELVLSVGADEIIATREIFQRTAQITGATLHKPILGQTMPMGGFHRVYDTIGNSKTLNTCMRVLGSMGVLSVVGIGKDVKLDLTPLWLKLQTIKGVFAYGRVDYQGEKKHVFEVALDLMDKKKISADILVTHRFSLEKYREMIAVNMNKGKHRAIKTIVIF